MCATSPSSPTSTTEKPRWLTPCCGNRECSEKIRTSTIASWTLETWSAKRALRSWRKTRPSTTPGPVRKSAVIRSEERRVGKGWITRGEGDGDGRREGNGRRAYEEQQRQADEK